jgi:hypothetical protein
MTIVSDTLARMRSESAAPKVVGDEPPFDLQPREEARGSACAGPGLPVAPRPGVAGGPEREDGIGLVGERRARRAGRGPDRGVRRLPEGPSAAASRALPARSLISFPS